MSDNNPNWYHTPNKLLKKSGGLLQNLPLVRLKISEYERINLLKFILVQNSNLKYVAIEKIGVENMAKKVTSAEVASKASKILRDGRYSDTSKSVAGSALSQKEYKKKK